jgi:hypothetical protein
VGDSLVRTVPAIPESVGAGPGAGIAWALRCRVRARCTASSFARGAGVFALPDSAGSVSGLDVVAIFHLGSDQDFFFLPKLLKQGDQVGGHVSYLAGCPF